MASRKYTNQVLPSAVATAIPKKAIVGSATTGVNPALVGPVQVELPIVNLDHTAQVQMIEHALNGLDGVQKASVNLAMAKAYVTYDPERLSLADMQQAIKKAGPTVGGAKVQIGIKDLSCASCVTSIEETLRATPGVLKAPVNVVTQQADVEYLPEMATPATLRHAIESTGYKTVDQPPGELPEDAERTARLAEYRELRRGGHGAPTVGRHRKAPAPESIASLNQEIRTNGT